MKSILVFGTLIIFMTLSATAQVVIGHVNIADKTSGEPIPYATLISGDNSVGFVSNIEGEIDSAIFPSTDSLEARSIGYESMRFAAQNFDNLDIYLKPKVLELNEVVIRPIAANQYVLEALKQVPDNYARDSFLTSNYFLEELTENKRTLVHTEAFLETLHPDYGAEKDSFEIHIIASRSAQKDDLSFMQKEREKELKKEIKEAAKEGEILTEEDLDWTLELGHPAYILYLDPLRHPQRSIQVNEDNIDFLDRNNHDDYDFWYGKPVAYGNKTLVVIEFDQKDKVKRPMLAGTIWIDQETQAFVKIAFGLSKKGEKHILPMYAKAAMWIYGLSYELYDTWVEFNYRTMNDRWLISSVRLKADLFLEKRRLFKTNDKGRFRYTTEMLTSEHFNLPHSFQSDVHFDPEKRLSDQLVNVSDKKWNQLKASRRSYR